MSEAINMPLPDSLRECYRVKAFTRDLNAGSEAGVYLDVADLNDRECQAMAARIGAATTAFCSQKKDSVDIRFFTPRAASSICIHALVASAHVMWSAGRLSASTPMKFNAMADTYPVTVSANGRVSVQVPDAVIGDQVDDKIKLARALGSAVADIGPTPVQIAGTGKAKLVVPVIDLDALLDINVDAAALKQICIELNADGVFLFAPETVDPRADYHARHFNPLALDSEDPICGIGSGALAAYLYHFDLIEKPSFAIEQGISTRNPGVVHVDTSGAITVGGDAVIISMPHASAARDR